MTAPRAPIDKLSDFPGSSKWNHDIVEYIDRTGSHVRAKGRTADASALTLFEKELKDESLYFVTAVVLGKKDDSSDRATYIRRVVVYRDGGVATIQGAVDAELTIESDASWDADFNVSSNKVSLDVTGKAGTDIDWLAHINWFEIKN